MLPLPSPLQNGCSSFIHWYILYYSYTLILNYCKRESIAIKNNLYRAWKNGYSVNNVDVNWYTRGYSFCNHCKTERDWANTISRKYNQILKPNNFYLAEMDQCCYSMSTLFYALICGIWYCLVLVMASNLVRQRLVWS